ncbi:unnamed protein product [Meganyctiphanes norvegica]|uniref:Uncharacterized protein n=1 Tax=Meganyctiphanes norvegica TaxID=48144 RepID=A0AAV2PTC1_MEGNR
MAALIGASSGKGGGPPKHTKADIRFEEEQENRTVAKRFAKQRDKERAKARECLRKKEERQKKNQAKQEEKLRKKQEKRRLKEEEEEGIPEAAAGTRKRIKLLSTSDMAQEAALDGGGDTDEKPIPTPEDIEAQTR